jgi:hypothetical protein
MEERVNTPSDYVSVSTREENVAPHTAGLVFQFMAYRVPTMLTETALCEPLPRTELHRTKLSDLYAGSLYKEHAGKRLVLVFTESVDVAVQLQSLQ